MPETEKEGLKKLVSLFRSLLAKKIPNVFSDSESESDEENEYSYSESDYDYE